MTIPEGTKTFDIGESVKIIGGSDNEYIIVRIFYPAQKLLIARREFRAMLDVLMTDDWNYIPNDVEIDCSLIAVNFESVKKVEVRNCVMYCPDCGEQHLDHGDWKRRAHHTHLCIECGFKWRVEPYCIGVASDV